LTQPVNVNVNVQVTSFHAGSLGGGVMIGHEVASRQTLVRVRVSYRVLLRPPISGEVWRIRGQTALYPVRDPKTGRIEELEHIDAAWVAPSSPQGSAIRRWIARNPAIPGVGKGYADRLWDAFGERLYDLIRARDVKALAAVLDVSKASAIVEAFGLLLQEVTALQELDEMGLEGSTASTAVRLFGGDAARRFRENPYGMTLLEPWTKVDAAALASGIAFDDPRRSLAAVEVAAAQAFRTSGSNLGGNTVVTRAGLVPRLRKMLRPSAYRAADEAIDAALAAGVLREVSPGRYQARGPDLMEREVEAKVSSRLSRPRPYMDRAVVAVAIAELERTSGMTFEPEQRQAVMTALDAGVCIIDGSAGTGKTSIVRAVLHAHLRLKRGEILQVALSGRAAKRLADATAHEAFTIYRLQKDLETGKKVMHRGLLVIDEFSMVSTPDLWRLLTAISDEVDVLLVGDLAQLPPLTAGNPALAFSQSAHVPRLTLGRVHRQAEATGIPVVAKGIRTGTLPDVPYYDPLKPDRPGVFVLPCSQVAVPGKVLEVFSTLSGLPPSPVSPPIISVLHEADVQVLTMTRHGPTGSLALSEDIERKWLSDQPAVDHWGFSVGSKLLWVRNSYRRSTGRRGQDGDEETVDLMNGALGVILRATSTGAVVAFDDGTETEVRKPDLGNLLRGWAITVHKAQGSAFRTVIIPVVRCRLLDRAMLYTALTRGRERVVLVGDIALAQRVVEAPARAGLRLQALTL
jgi:exodeoxyribonuclease V alpha subunit